MEPSGFFLSQHVCFDSWIFLVAPFHTKCDAYIKTVWCAPFCFSFWISTFLFISANAEIESAKKSGDAEVTVLRAQLKKAEMKISSMEKDIEQKVWCNSLFKSILDTFIDSDFTKSINLSMWGLSWKSTLSLNDVLMRKWFWREYHF